MTTLLEMAQHFVQNGERFQTDGMGLLLFGDVGIGPESYRTGSDS